MNTYEGLFIFPEALADAPLAEVIKRIHGEVGKLGGAILESEILGRRTFARRMQKRDAGHYVRMVFHLDPGQMAALRGRCRLIDDIFRLQIVRMSAQEVVLWQARRGKNVAPKGEDV